MQAPHLHDRLLDTGRFSKVFEASFGREFTLRFDGDVPQMQQELLAKGYLAGLDLGRFGRDAEVLFAVTERRTRQEMDAFVEEVSSS